MLKETNLDEVKKVADNFLYIDVSGQNSRLWPLFVVHPIFENGTVWGKNEMLDITTPEGLKKAREVYHERIMAASTLRRVTMMIVKSYRMAFLKYMNHPA